MSSNNIGGNIGNDASGIDWKRVASPDLLEQMDNSIKVQIVKVDEQLQRRHDKIMKRAAEQEAQRKAEEEKHKAEEEAKQKAEEEEKKQKAKENKRRAEEEYRAQAEVKRKQKANVREATKAFRAKIAQEGAQGMKPRVRNLSLSYFSCANFLFCFYSLVGQRANACLTRASKGGIPLATIAGEAATARGVSCPRPRALRHVAGAVWPRSSAISRCPSARWRGRLAGRKEGERDVGDCNRDIAKRRQEVQEDKEGSCRSREYQGDRRGDGELFGGGAIDPARPSCAGLRPLTW